MTHSTWILVILCLFLVFSDRVHAEPPNIVMILADDQSYRDFGFLGNEQVHTPHLDQLAKASAVYPNGYVPMSVCRPSLATLLTGLYPHQHGIHFNHPPPGLKSMRQMTAAEYQQTRALTDPYIEQVPTLPRILAKHGYACFQTGKHWEGSYRTAGFTAGMTLARPADRLGAITGTREQANGEWVAHGNGDSGLIIGRETMQPIEHFIEQHAGERPFFVWYAPFLPHTPYDAPQHYHVLYSDKEIPTYLRPYYAEIARFDETVGQLLDLLKNKSLLTNTLIVFAVDNGIRPDQQHPDRQNKRSKLSVYEDGLRTPVLLRWDGHIPPGEYTELVQTVDLVPTILSAAGHASQITPRMRGINLFKSARQAEAPPERSAYGAIYPNDAHRLGKPSQHVRARWIRSGAWKLIVTEQDSNSSALNLFHLGQDPWEQHNLAEKKQHAELIEQLRHELDQWWSGQDDHGVTNLQSANHK